MVEGEKAEAQGQQQVDAHWAASGPSAAAAPAAGMVAVAPGTAAAASETAAAAALETAAVAAGCQLGQRTEEGGLEPGRYLSPCPDADSGAGGPAAGVL